MRKILGMKVNHTNIKFLMIINSIQQFLLLSIEYSLKIINIFLNKTTYVHYKVPFLRIVVEN